MIRTKDLHNIRLEIGTLNRLLRIAQKELETAISKLEYNPVYVAACENRYRNLKKRVCEKEKSLKILIGEVEPERVPAWEKTIPCTQSYVTAF
jgi:hypothetical protein